MAPWSVQLNPQEPLTAAFVESGKEKLEHAQGNEKETLLKEEASPRGCPGRAGGTWLHWGPREPRGWQAQGRQPCLLPRSQCPAAHCPQSLPTTLGRQEHLPVSSSQGSSCRVPRALQAHPGTRRGWVGVGTNEHSLPKDLAATQRGSPVSPFPPELKRSAPCSDSPPQMPQQELEPEGPQHLQPRGRSPSLTHSCPVLPRSPHSITSCLPRAPGALGYSCTPQTPPALCFLLNLHLKPPPD